MGVLSGGEILFRSDAAPGVGYGYPNPSVLLTEECCYNIYQQHATVVNRRLEKRRD